MSRDNRVGRSLRNGWRWRRLTRPWRLSGTVLLTVTVTVIGAGALASGLPNAAASAGSVNPAIPAGGAVIRWTGHGIPHILASGYQGLGYGQGYAFASQNACVLADAMLTIRGQRSRWFGPDATTGDGKNNLASDLYYTEQNQTGQVQRLLAASGPLAPSAQARALVRGYVAGYNRYLAEHPGAGFTDPACRGAAWVTPITELDLWRLEYQQAEMGGSSGIDNYIGATVPPPSAKTEAARSAGSGGPAQVPALLATSRASLGSNAIALGKAATVSGTGMLLANPHLPWQGMMRFFEEQVTIPGVLDASGVAMFGMPMVVIGHTDRLAWSHTWATAVPATLTRLVLAPGDPTSYVVDGRVRKMIAISVTVPVRQAGGAIGKVTRTMYRTPDGPLISFAGISWSTRNAFVMHDANAGNLRPIDQWLAFDRSHSVAQLRQALNRYQAIPTFNTIASDSTGTAYFGDVQVLPAVTDALAGWCGLGFLPSSTLMVLDGSRSACRWGTEAGAVQPGQFAPGQLPTLIRNDYVANSNDSPWLTNPAAPLISYPAIVGDLGTARSPRTRLGLEMIAQRLAGADNLGRPGFTLAQMQTVMLSNRNFTAESGRDDVVRLCRAHPVLTAADGTKVNVSAACAVLAGWDLRGNLNSKGAVLWREFMRQVGQAAGSVSMWRVPFDPSHPVTTPSGINTTLPAVQAALAETVRAFTAGHVPLDVTLGTAQRFGPVPVPGCTDSLEGCFNVIEPGGGLGPAGVYPDVSQGSSFIMAIELTPSGPHGRTILTYSQSADIASPFHADQTRMFAAKRWVTDRFTQAEITSDPSLTVQVLAP